MTDHPAIGQAESTDQVSAASSLERGKLWTAMEAAEAALFDVESLLMLGSDFRRFFFRMRSEIGHTRYLMRDGAYDASILTQPPPVADPPAASTTAAIDPAGAVT